MAVAPISGHTTVVAAGELLSTEFSEESVILNLRDGVYYGLDNVGARIWGLIQQPITVNAVRDVVVSEYDVSPDKAWEDLLQLLHALTSRGLVEFRESV
jgi:hypothetical protein